MPTTATARRPSSTTTRRCSTSAYTSGRSTPGTGAADERGAGAGEGATVNVPVPAGVGEADYLELFDQVALPAVRSFAPDLLIVSAGFDAHRDDPLCSPRA